MENTPNVEMKEFQGKKEEMTEVQITPLIDELQLFRDLGAEADYVELNKVYGRYEKEIFPPKKRKLLQRVGRIRSKLNKVLEKHGIKYDEVPMGFRKSQDIELGSLSPETQQLQKDFDMMVVKFIKEKDEMEKETIRIGLQSMREQLHQAIDADIKAREQKASPEEVKEQ